METTHGQDSDPSSPHDVVVMKFGGTSVQDTAAIRRLTRAVTSEPRRRIVVVSALAGVTDALCSLADHATARREALVLTERLCARHVAIARDLVDGSRCLRLVERLRLRFQAAATAASVPRAQWTARHRDALLAIGELASSELVAAVLASAGVASSWLDARQVVITDDAFGHARPDAARIHESAAIWLQPSLRAGWVPVLGGFVGATLAGVTSTLGRGGSDYTASLVGAAVAASEVQIWTDVDGVFSADPRAVATAALIPSLTFHEAYELARFGAKVLHWGTLEPAAAHDIPVRVLNARHAAADAVVAGSSLEPAVAVPHGTASTRLDRTAAKTGTLIAAGSGDAGPSVVAIAERHDVTIVDLRAHGMTGSAQFLRSSLEWLERSGHALTVVHLSPTRLVVAEADEPALVPLITALQPVSRVELLDRVALVTLVGTRVSAHPGAWAAVHAAQRRGLVRMAVAAQSGDALVCVTTPAQARQLLVAWHDQFIGAPARTLASVPATAPVYAGVTRPDARQAFGA